MAHRKLQEYGLGRCRGFAAFAASLPKATKAHPATLQKELTARVEEEIKKEMEQDHWSDHAELSGWRDALCQSWRQWLSAKLQ